MPLVAFSIKLDRIDETTLYQDPGGGWWLGGVCTLDTDQKGRMVVAQSISKERYAAGERGRPLGTWREIGKPKTDQTGEPGKPKFDLNKYKNPPAQTDPTFKNGPPQQGSYPQGEERFLPSPQTADDGAKGPQQKPEPTEQHGLSELGF